MNRNVLALVAASIAAGAGAGGVAGRMSAPDAKRDVRSVHLSKNRLLDGGVVWEGQACASVSLDSRIIGDECWHVVAPVNEQMLLEQQNR